MKPNSRGRFNNRHGNSPRASRTQTIFRNTSLESSGPCGKLRGTALQLHEKYVAAAKDALIQNDEVLAEMCFQYADHYMHIQNQAILNEQNFHAQQQAAHQAQLEQQAQEQQPVEQPTETEEAESAPVLDSEEQLKVVDLSVPVAAMNAQAEPKSEGKPQRRTLRPIKSKEEPQGN